MKKTLAVVLLFFLFHSAGTNAAEWADLFDGKTLNGWEVKSGFATYTVEGGVIVGTTVEGSPNTFLCTVREYGDFILEFEVKADEGLNSGVQFRSLIADDETVFWFRGSDGIQRERKLPEGRVFGYQVEVSNENLHNCGYIYDEARRAYFLNHDREDQSVQTGFKAGQWNRYRVECKGSSIKTWVNGMTCTDLADSMTNRGVIGLQVHGIRNNFKQLQVRFRNIRIQEIE